MEKVWRYVASGPGLALTGVVVAIAVGEGAPNPSTQPVPVQIEFAALGLAMAGSIVALKWTRIGGAAMIVGSFMFGGVEWVVNHRPFPFVPIFALAGLLHLAGSAANRPETRRHAECRVLSFRMCHVERSETSRRNADGFACARFR